MMKILSVNAGSSSMKFQLFDMPSEKVLVSSTFERIGLNNSFYTIKVNGQKIKKEASLENHTEAVCLFLNELQANKFVSNLDEIEAVGHRVVHGGDKYSESAIIDEKVIEDIKSFIPLAPLHNPAGILGINSIREALPDAVNVAIFDTAFHQTMEDEAFIYPIPYEWYTENAVRRYGFHGTSYQYVATRIADILGTDKYKAIICHLGNGASITAIKDGKCVDTSMGITPIAGIPMGTRCGDIDPSIIEYMMKTTGKSIDDIMFELNKKSGLLGVSGISSDSRDIEEAIEKGNERAILAQKIYVRSILSFIASYYCILGGADVIAFTAGIGENSALTRKDIMNALEPLGVKIDEEANKGRGEECLISSAASKIKCYVIPTDEELMMGRETYELSK
ncbi:MAG: acetate kinase [Bacilli bacterium]|nr:acetate kinase [Bacilli bacterium]MDD3305375.1 acetate kinase [Bacilli bacterium]MDD4053428.1 acetate kinase [Bacilli bacterium]MDD4410925.1 acetate kinase [Bacilli bacterium]